MGNQLQPDRTNWRGNRVARGAERYGTNAKNSKSDPFYKGGKHLIEWENEDLSLSELKLKLKALEEGNDDQWLIDEVKKSISKKK